MERSSPRWGESKQHSVYAEVDNSNGPQHTSASGGSAWDLLLLLICPGSVQIDCRPDSPASLVCCQGAIRETCRRLRDLYQAKNPICRYFDVPTRQTILSGL